MAVLFFIHIDELANHSDLVYLAVNPATRLEAIDVH
jgi:hypothetical protein